MDIAEKNAEKENKTGFNIFKKICDTITGVIHGIFHHVFWRMQRQVVTTSIIYDSS